MLKGNVADVASVSLYAVDGTDSAIPEEAKPLAVQNVTLPEGEGSQAVSELPVTLTLAEPFVLKEGINNFRVLLNLSQDALSGDEVTVLAQSVSTADTLVNAVASADSITFSIKNIFNLQAGDNGEVLVSEPKSIV